MELKDLDEEIAQLDDNWGDQDIHLSDQDEQDINKEDHKQHVEQTPSINGIIYLILSKFNF